MPTATVQKLTAAQLQALRRAPGNRIRAARELLELSQVELAGALGLTQSTISDLERGRYARTSVETAQELAACFGCGLDDLYPAKGAARR